MSRTSHGEKIVQKLTWASFARAMLLTASFLLASQNSLANLDLITCTSMSIGCPSPPMSDQSLLFTPECAFWHRAVRTCFEPQSRGVGPSGEQRASSQDMAPLFDSRRSSDLRSSGWIWAPIPKVARFAILRPAG
jgi:hypothetical protein